MEKQKGGKVSSKIAITKGGREGVFFFFLQGMAQGIKQEDEALEGRIKL